MNVFKKFREQVDVETILKLKVFRTDWVLNICKHSSLYSIETPLYNTLFATIKWCCGMEQSNSSWNGKKQSERDKRSGGPIGL